MDKRKLTFTFHLKWKRIQCICGQIIFGNHRCDNLICPVQFEECNANLGGCEICDYKCEMEDFTSERWQEQDIRETYCSKCECNCNLWEKCDNCEENGFTVDEYGRYHPQMFKSSERWKQLTVKLLK